MNALDVLEERGFVKQVTDKAALKALLAAEPVVFYTGYDPTAGSLHVGHLVQLMANLHLQRLGHEPLLLVGGATALIGDPSGKTELRQMLKGEEIQQNTNGLLKQFRQIFKSPQINKGLKDCRVVDNNEWLRDYKYIDFLRDIGRHFSVNRMLTAESYKLRLAKGLSFLEFNYQLLQAYDFLELHRRYGCMLQIGGDDQWSNILAGVDLCRRVAKATVQALTTPLVVTSTGEKMGKTVAGAVWLDADKVSPYAYYQYWINLADADVRQMLAFFTFLPMAEIDALFTNLARSGDSELLNFAKTILAYESTVIVHGEEQALAAKQAAEAAFRSKQIPKDLLPTSTIPRNSSADLAAVPTTNLAKDLLPTGILLLDILVDAGLASSKNAARTLIEQGGVKINDEKITDIYERLTESTVKRLGNDLLLRVGKKKTHRLVFS